MNTLRPRLLFLLSLAVSAPVQADVVKCVTKGSTSYQETPCDKGRMKAVDVRPSSVGIQSPSQGVAWTPPAADNRGPAPAYVIPVPESRLPLRSTVGDVKPAYAGGYSVR